MSIPKPKAGRTSKYKPMLESVISGELQHLTFKTRSNADNCANYGRTHIFGYDFGVRKESKKEFRVYVEVRE